MGNEMFDDFENFLGEVAGHLESATGGGFVSKRKSPIPDSENPKDYVRFQEIDTDEDARLLNSKSKSNTRAFALLLTECQTQWLELQAAKNRMHLHLQRKYPDITTGDTSGGFGIREYDGHLYVVSWDDTSKKETT